MTVIVLVGPPPGPAYNFLVNLYVLFLFHITLSTFNTGIRYTYPGAWINGAVAGGLIYLRRSSTEGWSSPWRTWLPVVFIYLFLNIFLAVTPFIPPNDDWNADGYPYYAFPLVGTGVLGLGAVYWLVWTKVLPRLGGYELVAEKIIDETGAEVVRYRKISARNSPSAEGESLLRRRTVASSSADRGSHGSIET